MYIKFNQNVSLNVMNLMRTPDLWCCFLLKKKFVLIFSLPFYFYFCPFLNPLKINFYLHTYAIRCFCDYYLSVNLSRPFNYVSTIQTYSNNSVSLFVLNICLFVVSKLLILIYYTICKINPHKNV